MNTGGPNWNFNSWNNERGGFRGRGGRGKSNFRGRQNFRGNQGYRGFRGGGGGGGGNRQDRLDNFKNQDKKPHWNIKTKRDMPCKRLTEDQIGVTEYISDHKGFSGIIKSRYSDFQVAEINERGEIAKLTDTSPPIPPCEEEVVDDEDLILNKYNLEILPLETWDNINKLAMTDDKNVVEINVTEVSKEQRTKIHDAVKKAFGVNIVGSTVNIDDKKLIRFAKYTKGVKIDNRIKWVWPGEYVYFIVHKENCDTMEAAQRIAERMRLNIKSSLVGYAGTKDRRAKTSQWFSMRKVDPRKIASACQGMREIHVGNYSFRPQNIRLGMLSGNEFRIALRNVTAPVETVTRACELLQENGFINYYGLQRFGTRIEIPTYQIGLKLLQGNFKDAIDDILAERPGPLEKALRAYKESGAAAALSVWPRKATGMEHRLVKALANCPKDLLGAMDKLARNARLLYLHSYQSLVWNRAVSARLHRLGLRPVVGDLVPVDLNIQDPVEEIDLMDDDDESSEVDSKESNDAPCKTELKTESGRTEQRKIPVKVLTQEDLDSDKYSIFDIIMPLPGHAVEYPPNMVEFYRETLEKDSLTLDMKHKYKSYALSGAYRHVAVRPVNMRWEVARYSDPTADLLLSDWDRLQGREKAGVTNDGKYTALILTMNLPASCYATMALRELLRVDTAGDSQAAQNNYYKNSAGKEDKGVKAEGGGVKEEVDKDAKKEPEESSEEVIKAETEDITEQDSERDIKEDILENVKEASHAEKRKIESDSTEVEVKKIKEDKD